MGRAEEHATETRALRPPAQPQRIHAAFMDFGWGAGPLSACAGGGGSDLNLLGDNLLLDLDDRTLQVRWVLTAVTCSAAAVWQRQCAWPAGGSAGGCRGGGGSGGGCSSGGTRRGQQECGS